MNFDGFLGTIPIMINGMMGIFIVIGVIYIMIAILNKYCVDKK